MRYNEMRSWIFILLLATITIVVAGNAKGAGECGPTLIVDDCNVTGIITLNNSNVYYINDSGSNGVFIIRGGNTVLDCNNSMIIGNSASNSRGIAGASNYNNVTIKNCNIKNYNYNIRISGYNMTIMNNYCENGYSVYTAVGNNIMIKNNVFNRTVLNIDGATIDNVTIKNNSIRCINSNCSGSQTRAIDIRKMSNFNINENTIDNSEIGIFLFNGTYGNIYNNIIENTDRGIYMNDVPAVYTSRTTNIYSNTFRNNTNNYDLYQLDILIDSINSTINIYNNDFLESVDMSIYVDAMNGFLNISNNNFSMICNANRGNYAGHSQNEPCTAIKIGELFKTWCYPSGCINPYTLDKVRLSDSSNIIIGNNNFNDDTNVFIFLQGATNVTLINIPDYWYREFTFNNFTSKISLYINNLWNYVNTSSNSPNYLYEGYRINSTTFHKYDISKTRMTFYNSIPITYYSVNITNSLFNYPYNDIYNVSTASVLSSNIDNYSLTLSAGQQIIVGDYTNLTSITFNVKPINNSYYNVNYSYANITIAGRGFSNVTIYLYNSTGLYTSNQTFTNMTSHNFTNLPDEQYKINATALDMSGASINSETINFTIDTKKAGIEYISPTPDNAATVTGSINISINITDNSANYTTINVYSENNVVVFSGTGQDKITSLYINNLPNGVYYYNATTCDMANNCNNTATRTITSYTSGGPGPGMPSSGGTLPVINSTPLIIIVQNNSNNTIASIVTNITQQAQETIVNATAELQAKAEEIKNDKANQTVYIIIGIIFVIVLYILFRDHERHKHITRA